MDLDQVRELFQDDPNQMNRWVRSVTAYTKNITGSPAYWWARRTEVGALVRHKHFFNNELPIGFHSGSLAEHHMPGLHFV